MSRREKEAILVPYELGPKLVVMEGTSTAVDELTEDGAARILGEISSKTTLDAATSKS
jgi:hypothetical protein